MNGVGRGLDRQTSRGSEAPRKRGDALGEAIQPGRKAPHFSAGGSHESPLDAGQGLWPCRAAQLGHSRMEALKGVPEHKPRPRRVRRLHTLLVKRRNELPPASFLSEASPSSLTPSPSPEHTCQATGRWNTPEATQAISPAGKHAPGFLSVIWEFERKNIQTKNIKSAAAEEADKEDLKVHPPPNRAEEALL